MIVTQADMFDLLPLKPKDMSEFVIVKPGEVYNLESDQTRESFFVSDGTPSRSRLRPGSYLLQLDVATWTFLEDSRSFRKAWRDKGYLWSEGITSEPMPFTIEEDRPIVKCP